MAMPCLPAYGGYHPHWLKAVRKQQAAYAALHLERAETQDLNELPTDSSAEELAVVTAVAGAATAPLVTQALNIARQHGFPAPEAVSALEASMPRSKPEKQVNKQAMATVSTQLNPAHIKLQPRTPDKPQPAPRQPASSPVQSHPLLTGASRTLQPVFLSAVAKQQLLSFCSTASCSTPTSAHDPQPPVTEALPVQSGRETCWGSRSSITLEEPIIFNAAAAADKAWRTAEEEANQHPNPHNILTFKGCTMQCPEGGFGNLWLRLADDAPGTCDALYTKVEAVHRAAKPLQQQLFTRRTLDNLIESTFKAKGHKDCQLQQKPQTALHDHPAALPGGQTAVCLQRQVTTVAAVAACNTAKQSLVAAAEATNVEPAATAGCAGSLAAAESAVAACHQQSTADHTEMLASCAQKIEPSCTCGSSKSSQEGAEFLLEEPMLAPLDSHGSERSPAQQQNTPQVTLGETAQLGHSVMPAHRMATGHQLVNLQQLVCCVAAQPVGVDDDNSMNVTDEVPTAAAAAAADVAATSSLTAAAGEQRLTVYMPWEKYTAVDFEQSELWAKPAATNSSRPSGEAVQQRLLQLPDIIAACVLPTAGLLQGSPGSSRSMICDATSRKQQCKQHPPGSTTASGPGTSALIGVLQSAVVAAAAASSRRDRRNSSRFAETPVCAAAGVQKLSVAAGAATPAAEVVTPCLEKPWQDQPECSHALQEDATMQDPQQQQQHATVDTCAVGPQLSQYASSPAVVMALRTPFTVAVSAAMTAAAAHSAAAGQPNALSMSAVSAAAVAEDEDVEAVSQSLPLSPSDMTIEAPVCLHEYKGPLLQEQLLQEVLQVAHQLVMQPAAAAADSQQPQYADGWNASWGYLKSATAADAGASSITWWAGQAVQDLFSGQYPATLQDGELAGKLPSNPDHARKLAGKCPAGAVDPSNLGSLLLEQMLAADMQVDSSSLLLPVTLFPEDVRLGAAAAAAAGCSSDGREADFIMQLISDCGCKRQSPAHLELYFDWSWLQPLPTGTAVAAAAADGAAAATAAAAAVGFKRQRSAAETAAAATPKRPRQDCDVTVDSSQMGAATTSAAVAPAPFNIHAWISLLQKQLGAQSKQLFREFGQQHAVQTDAAAAAVKWQKREHGWCMHAMRDCMQLFHQQQEPVTRGNHTDWATDAASCLEEKTSPAVAAAAADWEAAHAAGQSAVSTAAAEGGRSVATAPAGTAAAAGAGGFVVAAGGNTAVSGAGTAAASDMDFFMQLQNLAAAAKNGSRATRASKRRLSIAQQQQLPTDASPRRSIKQQCQEVGYQSVPVAGPTSGGGKRSRIGASEPTGLQHSAEAALIMPSSDDERDQIMHEDATPAAAAGNDQQQHCVADLALNGIPRGQPSGAAAAARCTGDQQQKPLVVVQPPTELQVSLPLALLQIMLTSQGNRKAILASMQDPDHSLLSCKLWDDMAVQHVITQLQKSAATSQDEPATGMQHQKQHARKLGSLLILAQTAGCLLHYGVRVAHLFLQHSLQKLPSLAAACAEAAAALARAYEAVEKLPAAAVCSSGSSSSGGGGALTVQEDHPKLGRLRDLLVELKAAKLGCKVLIVAETKAFFSLYQSISAAGLTAVQLDRTKKLLQTPHTAAAADGGDQVAGDANPAAAAAAWEAAVTAALQAGQCVLTTHEHLMHRSMPIDCFDYLVEYITLDSIPAAAAATTKNASSSTRRDKVVVKFSGCHYVFKMVTPDLRQATADIAAAAAAEQQQQQSSVADLPTLWPSTAAATAAAGLHNTLDPPLPAVTPATAAAAAAADPQTTAAAAAAAVEVAQPPQALAGPQFPLVLNRSSGSLLHQRKALYESLLQLEGQGYLLVERNLGSAAAAGGGSRGISSSGTAAVDIVLSPVACLIVWGETRLSQDACSTMTQLSQALLRLSMSYEAVHIIFELPDAVLQLTVKQLPCLQQVAAAVGVKLHIMISFSAANTQDYVHAICKSAASRFWSSSSSSGSSSGLRPPSISDLPTPQEAFLNSCCALNPLSAAVLASKGVSLQALINILVAGQPDPGDEQSKQLLTQLSVGIPERSTQLLAAQVMALHLKLESDSPQLPRNTSKGKLGLGRADQRLQQQQQHEEQQQVFEEYAQQQQQEQQQHMYQQQQQVYEQYAQQHQQEQQQQQMYGEYAQQHQQEQQQQQQMYQQQPDCMGQQEVLQRHHQTHPAAAALGHGEAAADWQNQQHGTADRWQQQEHAQRMAYHHQQPYTVHANTYDHTMEEDVMPEYHHDLMDADNSYMHNAQQQRQQQQMQQQPIAGMDIDPAGVLDAFLNSRKQQHNTAVADGSRAGGAPQQQFRHQRQQQQFSAERVATHHASHRQMGYMHLPQQQHQQQASVLVDDDELPDIALPFAEMPGDAGPHQQQQQQWFDDPYGNHHHQQQQQQEEEEDFDPHFDLRSIQRQNQHGSLYGRVPRFDQPPPAAAAALEEAAFYDQRMAPAAFLNADMYDDSDVAFKGVQRPRGGNTNWRSSKTAVGNMFGRPTAVAAAADAGQDLFGVRRRPQTETPADQLRREAPSMFTAGGALVPPPVQSGHRGARNPMFGPQLVTNSKSRQIGAARAAAGMFGAASLGSDDHVGGLRSGTDYFPGAGDPDSAWDAGFEEAAVGGYHGPGSDNPAIQDSVFRGSRSVKGSLARGIRLGPNEPGGVGTGGQVKPTTSATTSRSSLMVEAFMPHRNPSKQLKYRKGFGLAKGKGKQQSKLYWG